MEIEAAARYDLVQTTCIGVSDVCEGAGVSFLGGCVGHHCRLTSGLIIYPARMIESDVVLQALNGRHVITSNVAYEDSAHHQYSDRIDYPRLYPRKEPPAEMNETRERVGLANQ